MIGMRSMGKVKASNVHACPQKFLNHGNRSGRRSKRANDLCLGLLLGHDISFVVERHRRSSKEEDNGRNGDPKGTENKRRNCVC